MSGWDEIDPAARKVGQMVNDHANAGIFWDEPQDRECALAIVRAVRGVAAEEWLRGWILGSLTGGAIVFFISRVFP